MLLSLITEHEYHTMRLPDRVEGRYTLNDPKNGNALFEIAAVNGKWIVLETENGRFVHADSLVLAHGILQAVRIGYDLERADLYSEDAGNSYAKYVRCPVQDTV